MTTTCQPSGNQDADTCPHSIGKDSIDKIRIEKDSIVYSPPAEPDGRESEYFIDDFCCKPIISHGNDTGSAFNFDVCWNAYPNRKGRAKVTKEALDELAQLGTAKILEAVRRYRLECAAEKRDTQYIQHGSTFFCGGYKDYISDDWKPPVTKDPDGVMQYNDFVLPF